MLALQIIITCVLYAVSAGITYFIINELIENLEEGAIFTSVFWPTTLIDLLLILIASGTVKFLKWLESIIKSKRK